MTHPMETKRVPEVVLHTRQDGHRVDVESRSLFEGRTVVVFSLPGAFTPTCSATHLPRYEQLAPELRRAGVDEIICLSVNDAFVMEAWGKAQNVREVRLLPDGNGEFSRGMGMLVDKSELGFGKRSWRYSMLVRNGVIEKVFEEPHVQGDPFEVSDADSMLRYLDPDARLPEPAALWVRPGCPHCARARSVLDREGIPYEEIVLGRDANTRALEAVAGAVTTPQVFIGGRRIGGADALEALFAKDAA